MQSALFGMHSGEIIGDVRDEIIGDDKPQYIDRISAVINGPAKGLTVRGESHERGH